MEKEHLAIASVPCQTWGETYEASEALRIGTIFTELNKPFFASNIPTDIRTGNQAPKNPEQKTREDLMTELYEVGFVLDDLTLYLDTHGNDKNALTMFQEYSKKRAQLKKEFAEKFYPLTRDCLSECCCGDQGFAWLEGPIPWEGACL